MESEAQQEQLATPVVKKINFKTETVRRDYESHCVMIQDQFKEV